MKVKPYSAGRKRVIIHYGLIELIKRNPRYHISLYRLPQSHSPTPLSITTVEYLCSPHLNIPDIHYSGFLQLSARRTGHWTVQKMLMSAARRQVHKKMGHYMTDISLNLGMHCTEHIAPIYYSREADSGQNDQSLREGHTLPWSVSKLGFKLF